MLRESHILIFCTFLAGLCSIVYELLIATTNSYFIGDSVTQFSLTIGVYMAAMGIGSYLSKWVSNTKLLTSFIYFELALAVTGGASVPLLYFAYAIDWNIQVTSSLLTALIGLLVGLEIPLLTRLMESHYKLKANIANVLSVDYFGALAATLLFPFFFLPNLGVFKTSIIFGLFNLVIAITLLFYFKHQLKQYYSLKLATLFSFVLLVLLIVFSKQLNNTWNTHIYEERVVHVESSQYQQLLVTRFKDDTRLYLNNNLQFSSVDEHRYHESLIHPAMSRFENAKSILMLGGGDGLAVRELLKYSSVNHITLVDLDPAVTALAKSNMYIQELNNKALESSKVTILHQDAFAFINTTPQRFDLIFVDLPDPSTISLARMYSKQFYHQLSKILTAGGIVTTQATSPFFAQKAFWSITNTMDEVFPITLPFHVNVPSFGEWGFVMACHQGCSQKPLSSDIDTKYYSADMDTAMFLFSKDLIANNVQINSLDDPKLLHYYLDGWKYWN